MLASSLLLVALAQLDMTPMLQRGPVVQVEEAKGGKFGQATAVTLVNAPPERVWAVVVNLKEYKSFMPKVTTSDVAKKGEKDLDVHFVIDVPGPDTDYTVRFTPNEATKTMSGNWVSGDLKGSTWLWKLEPAAEGKTLVTHSIAVKNFSSIAQSLEDDAQTVTVGINVSSVLAATKAVKRRVEEQK